MGYLDCLNPASDVKRLVQWFKTQELSALQQGAPNSTLEAVRQAILSCVTEASHAGFDVSRDELMIRIAERSLPFSYLSDGFRNMVAMVADIAVRCATLNPHLQEKASRETPGVVLIDELDLHLHPRWQRRVVDDLLRTFPLIQFFGTTHSPFIIQSLPPIEGVQLLNLDDEHADEFANKSVEDISEEIQGIELPAKEQAVQGHDESRGEVLRDVEPISRCQRGRAGATQGRDWISSACPTATTLRTRLSWSTQRSDFRASTGRSADAPCEPPRLAEDGRR